MSGLTALGVGSGLPLEDLVKQLVASERDPKVKRLDSQKSTIEVSLSGIGKIRSALSKFQSSLDTLKSANNLLTRKATVTHPDNLKPFDVTTTSSATTGSYSIEVKALAKGTRAETANGSFANSDSVVSSTAGQLTFSADGKSFNVNVTAGMTLSQLREAINTASDNIGVSANIINTGDAAVGSKLVITSSITGDPATKQLSITNNNAELDKVSTVATGGGTTLSVTSSQRAHVTIDNVDAYADTNKMENVIQNTTLNLKELTNTKAATLDIAVDKDTVKGHIEAFVKNYNELVTTINDLTKPGTLSTDGKSLTGGGALNGNSMVRGLMGQLNSQLAGTVSGADASLNSLFALGISMTADGKMEISSTNSYGGKTGSARLEDALTGSFDKISQLFSGDNGLAAQLESKVKSYTEAGGILASQEKVFNSRLTLVNTERANLDKYMESYEKTLRERYAALDKVLAQMNSTSSYLSSQLASLPGFSTQRN
ncbi:flagellar filament capping protein FliD [Balneatrix alpica]|uniref:flagellar filament capping protein FliD n=1 Tax=Balneatrix alpica TaxID=75684 RepID=UPI00273A4805|nr:flagellar filament capping protein FliD [Balneatrix alpica]